MDKSQNKRLVLVREHFNEGVTEFAARLGVVQQGTLSAIEEGERKKGDAIIYVGVSRNVRTALYEKLNVNRTWFETGKGNMFNDTPSNGKQTVEMAKKEALEYKEKYFNALEEIARLSKLLTTGLTRSQQ